MNIYGMLVSSVFVNKVLKETDHMVYKYIISFFVFQTPKITILGSKSDSIR